MNQLQTVTSHYGEEEEQEFGLTVASLKAEASRNAVHDDEADNMATIVLNETFELLDLLLDRVPNELLTFWIHVDMWCSEAGKFKFIRQ